VNESGKTVSRKKKMKPENAIENLGRLFEPVDGG
jgi:hypothetical protein